VQSIWIGFDPREAAAFAVCRNSMRRWMTQQIPIKGIVLSELQRTGLYRRPIEHRGGQLWDPISQAPMSTQFAISRFFTPILAKSGWALFTDCDIMALGSVARLFEKADPRYAVMCVQHKHEPDAMVKMDGQAQTRYYRKNWSSVMLFNCEHEANKILTVDMLNIVPGRDLHRFCWLRDEEIGELGPEWNYLVGHTKIDKKPQLVHFTSGTPSMAGYETCEFSTEYNMELELWAA
jgi:lipopolysaccharide biosynthesis glycosyltransferase